MTQTIEEKIRQRRLQLLVHSYIYYELNDSIVTDEKWTQWARELVQLQQDYPKEAAKCVYTEQFIGFDGSTGAFFVFDDKIKNTAMKLLQMRSAPLTAVGKTAAQKGTERHRSPKKKPTGRKLF